MGFPSAGAHSLDNGLASVINEIVQTGWQPKDTARVVSILRDISRLYVLIAGFVLMQVYIPSRRAPG